ncbi:MAG: type II toxin-antitoxin system RelE/ParE family toxin [Planctomyces sp.]
MRSVYVCSAAENDFTESLTWYAKQDSDLARQFDSEFDAAMNRIAESPETFPAIDERHRYMQMRRFPFVIIFREDLVKVTIIAVAHTSRSPGFWHGR